MAAVFRKAVLFLAVLLVLLLSFLAFRCQLSANGRRLRELKAQEEGLTETVTPVRFKLTARTADSISADFRFYDSSGAQTGKRSVTLPGQELHIDLAVYARADGSYSFLPYAVFSDRVAAADGILLADGPAGFAEEAAPAPATPDPAGPAGARSRYGNAVHDIKELSGFTPGIVYALRCHPLTGGVEISRD